MTTHTTRLAPSPTGALHLGNARTFLVNWAMARQNSWRVLLRIEDLDTPRLKPGAIDQTREILSWLGIDWDEEMPLQSSEAHHCVDAMRSLADIGIVYPCLRTRTDIQRALSAPNAGEGEAAFPPELRASIACRPFDRPASNWRFVCPHDEVDFMDVFAGPQRVRPADDVGDFVVWTRRASPSYQLAVVVDDARHGVTQVVRGADLIPSTGRQLLLYRALKLKNEPEYTHLPLVRGGDGRRLAKRHGDTRIVEYRDRGVAAERIIALIARWSGVGGVEAISAAEFAQHVRLDRMPRGDVTFSPEDDRWLLD
ncbi:MAG: glutamate--tRNA ligase family protein [Planctomycetota bacterium]